ncbi:MAG TPA: hypothetical protein VNX87_21770 [Candidatus Sulfotelmatobacter sp.]|jgi:hypothetical protein|nr:hypothetical protein [Candidatus Sulfotelmatobacter sp.]
MSEERRKRQQAGEKDSSKTKKVILYVVVAALFVGAYLAGRYYKNHKYDSFARCLATRNARMYGLYWCPHCADQKHEFGSSFHYVPYIECASENDPHELTLACKAAGVKLFPSWQFGAEPPKEGVLTLQELSQKTGCSLP